MPYPDDVYCPVCDANNENGATNVENELIECDVDGEYSEYYCHMCSHTWHS